MKARITLIIEADNLQPADTKEEYVTDLMLLSEIKRMYSPEIVSGGIELEIKSCHIEVIE